MVLPLSRDQICTCDHCAASFREAAGLALPVAVDWDDVAYRRWVRWSYDRRLAVWDLNNRVTREAGGPDCLWIGMNSGDILGQSRSLRDYRAICERSELVFLDNQTRRNDTGFQANGDMGKLIHGLLGWDKLVPESMAMYQSSSPTFRVAGRPEPEARMWMVEGFAGGIQPWWHHIGAYHEDRRQYLTAAPLMCWHAEHERYLVGRRPVASVGLVWSQENVDFFGREAPEERVMAPYWGMAQALIRARIPYVPVHAEDIGRYATGGDPRAGQLPAPHGHVKRPAGLSALILPNVGALSEAQADAVRRFVVAGGGLIATGLTGLYDLEGEPRPDFAPADLFGVHATGEALGAHSPTNPAWDAHEGHSYLRVRPELRAGVDGPLVGNEPALEGKRHAVLAGFEATDLLPFGGRLERVAVEAGATVPLTYIAPFPIYPPETAWMPSEAETGLPALVLNERPGQGRVAYLPASLDHAFARHNLPDHGQLLANLVRWVAGGCIPLRVSGQGLIDCHLYEVDEPQCLVLHMVNLSHPGAWRAPLHELMPAGPFEVAVQLPAAPAGATARCLVAESELPITIADGWAHFEVTSITDHEVVVIE